VAHILRVTKDTIGDQPPLEAGQRHDLSKRHATTEGLEEGQEPHRCFAELSLEQAWLPLLLLFWGREKEKVHRQGEEEKESSVGVPTKRAKAADKSRGSRPRT